MIRSTTLPTILSALFVASASFAQAEVSVNFSEHVAPIIFSNCTECHRPGQAGPFSLRNYDEVRKRGKLIAEVTADRYMPPWHADESDYPFAAERRLEKTEIETIQKWVKGGMPEGDSSKLPPLPKMSKAGWTLGEPDLVVEMPEAYEVPDEGPDIYRNFLVPLGLKEDKWVKAIEFRPSSPSVVHHSLYYIDTSGESRKREYKNPSPGFSRMPRGLEANGYIGGWALGGNPTMLPEGMAHKLSKDDDFVLSTHFHPSGRVEKEKSQIGFYFTDTPPTKAFTKIQLPPVFGALSNIEIPAGDNNYTTKDSFVLPHDVKAFEINAHAHYLGKKMKMTAHFPDGTKKVLLNITEWDFAWQEQYTFEEFVPLPKGTRLDSEVVWDNSADNPYNPSDPPVKVRWGRESHDEMGSVTIVVTTGDSEMKELTQAYQGHLRQTAAAAFAARALKKSAKTTPPPARSPKEKLIKDFDKDQDGKLNREERASALRKIAG